jgi:hypothetical protein
MKLVRLFRCEILPEFEFLLAFLHVLVDNNIKTTAAAEKMGGVRHRSNEREMTRRKTRTNVITSREGSYESTQTRMTVH